MSTLAVAIRKGEWELAALCLLLGVAEAAAALPPEALEGLLEVLADLEGQDGRPRGGARPVDPSTQLRAGRGRRR